MKSKFGKILMSLIIAATSITALTAAGCHFLPPASDGYYDENTVYAQVVSLGYTGTLEEFIALISGKDGTNGKDGVGIKNAYVNADGKLVLVMTDDSEIECDTDFTLPLPHEHTYGDWVLIKEADCTTAGLEVRGCEECGNTESKILPSLGHNWGAWVDRNATVHTRTCTRDGIIEKQNHTYDDDGICTVCGHPDTEFIPPVEEIDIMTVHMQYTRYPALGGSLRYHEGLDFAAEIGTEIFSIQDGTVESILENTSYGNTVTIVHSNGFKSVYGYIMPVEGFTEGDTVSKGDVIGTVIEVTGKESGWDSHLHFELYLNGKLVDPEEHIYFGTEETRTIEENNY